MNRKMLVVLNPNAGKKRAVKMIDAILAVIRASSDFEPELFVTTARGDATEKVAACAGEYDRIVVIGGDGSLNEACEGLLRSGVKTPLGYIPAGSTNDLASSMNLPGDLILAAQIAATGAEVPVDLATFNGRCFVYTASFGAFTRAAYAAPQKLKNAIGHLAYLIEGAKELTHIHRVPLSVETNGEVIEGDFLYGGISNTTSLGGVIKLKPEFVDLSDGKFELFLVKMPEHIGKLGGILSAVVSGNYDNEHIVFMKVENVTIHAEAGMPWTLDGEYAEGTETIDVRVLPGAVSLVLPE